MLGFREIRMNWKTFDWKSQKVGQKGEVLTRDVYRCGFCKGKGIVSRNKEISCPACSGTAEARIPGLAVICAYCNGAGRAHLNKDLTCNVCRGHGVVPIASRDIASCPACKGLGRECGSGLPCLACKGKGVISKGETLND
jgi:DnaJ-class molecular chaperone